MIIALHFEATSVGGYQRHSGFCKGTIVWKERCCRPALCAVPKAVAYVPDRLDEGAVGALDLRTQAPYMHIDGPGPAKVVVPPHLLQQLVPGVHAPRIGGQEHQQLVLLVSQDDPAAPEADLVLPSLDPGSRVRVKARSMRFTSS